MKTQNIKKVLIMAGGTGGHIFPGIAIAETFRQKNIQTFWLGNYHNMEAKIIPQHHIDFNGINIKPLRGKNLLQKLLFPFNLLKAIYDSRKIINKIQPDLIISMGGYVAGPGGLAALLSRIPLVIHEQNSIAGMTNKFLAKFADKIFTGFPHVLPKGIYIGNPVRADITKIQKTPNHSQKINLLIIGGSRGAKILNDIIPEAIKLLPDNIKPHIFHQTGENGSADYKNISAETSPFINNIAEKYQWADLIICRAGALTLAEITTAGLPAILIPYPLAVDDHQTKNAEFLTQNHAGILLPQADLTPEKLAGILQNLISNPDERLAMAEASYKLKTENSAEKMVGVILEGTY